MGESKKVNINDIAERAGVSIATVSRFLHGHLEKMSDKTAARIQAIIEEMNYIPNASAVQLMTQRSGLIAVMAADVDDYFSTEFFKGAVSILETEHYTGVLFDANADAAYEQRQLATIGRQNFDGLIMQPLTTNREVMQAALTRSLPVVLVDRELDQTVYDTVVTDNYVAARDVARYYQAHGIESVIVISEPLANVSTRKERWAGVNAIFKDASLLEVDANHVRSELLATQLVDQIRQSGKKTLVFFFKERLMLDIMPFFIRQQALSEQLQLTGFSDTKLARDLDPHIRLIEQDPFLMGATAAELLLAKLAADEPVDQATAKKIVIPASFS